MPIRQINVTFNVTERQYELLVMGKCDKPNPERVKRLLLNEAARQVRTTIEMGLRDEHDHKIAHEFKPLVTKPKSITAKLKSDMAMERLAELDAKARKLAKRNSGLDENNLYTDDE